MFGEAAKGANPFADSYSLSVTGLGGEPFETGQLSVSKNRLYDFRANWRQSYFYSNPNDNVILPIAAVASGLSTGLTDNHAWGTVRKFGSADLTLHATNNLRFNFDYYRTSDSGPTFTTESLDFFDSPSYWGTFARANPYYLYAPISDDTNRFTGGIDYTYHAWTFHYNLGYQTFTENVSLNNVSSPELSIDPVAELDARSRSPTFPSRSTGGSPLPSASFPSPASRFPSSNGGAATSITATRGPPLSTSLTTALPPTAPARSHPTRSASRLATR